MFKRRMSPLPLPRPAAAPRSLPARQGGGKGWASGESNRWEEALSSHKRALVCASVSFLCIFQGQKFISWPGDSGGAVLRRGSCRGTGDEVRELRLLPWASEDRHPRGRGLSALNQHLPLRTKDPKVHFAKWSQSKAGDLQFNIRNTFIIQKSLEEQLKLSRILKRMQKGS